MIDACVFCGEYVPEGRMICPQCEAKINERNIKDDEKTAKNSMDKLLS